jgi:hypothetical protein
MKKIKKLLPSQLFRVHVCQLVVSSKLGNVVLIYFTFSIILCLEFLRIWNMVVSTTLKWSYVLLMSIIPRWTPTYQYGRLPSRRTHMFPHPKARNFKICIKRCYIELAKFYCCILRSLPYSNQTIWIQV